MNSDSRPDPEPARYRLMVKHGARVAKLIRVSRLVQAFTGQARRLDSEAAEVAGQLAGNLGVMLVRAFSGEYEHGMAVLAGDAGTPQDMEQARALDRLLHFVEQCEAGLLELSKEPDKNGL